MTRTKTLTIILVAVSIIFLLVLISFFTATGKVETKNKSEKKEYARERPNIILMSIDTLRADHLHCYGYSRETSPHIDSFAKDAVLFRNAISPSPYTAPSHMSLFTGLTPFVHGVNNICGAQYARMNEKITTLAEVLFNNNYTTVGFHGGGNVCAELGFDKGFETYDMVPLQPNENFFSNDTGDLHATIQKARERNVPFFLFLHHYYCHDPYLAAPEKYRLRFLKTKVEGLPVCFTEIDPNSEVVNARKNLEKRMSGFDNARENFWKRIDLTNAAHREHIVSLYDGEVYYSDYLFGKLIKLLKEEKCYDNSIIILLGDHGEEFLEHGGTLHEKLFIETLHVPLLIKFPFNQYGDKVIDQHIRLFDIMPTLLSYVGIQTTHLMQAESFLPLLTKKGIYDPTILSFHGGKVRFLKKGFVYTDEDTSDSSEWLFDYRIDPQEKTNRASQKPKLLRKMQNTAKKIIKEQTAMKEKLDFDNKDKIDIKKDSRLLQWLKSLGYL
ncbi:MAG: sulfatase [Candidatus Omnitrophica bacterium]|nr:sulfatase [Candidatus Omnitrophota bacterium]